jgi:hypothetical protein
VLPRVRTSPLQPFNDVEISRAATMAATRQLKDELIVKRGGGEDVMWELNGKQSNQLFMIKWKGIALEHQSNQLCGIKIERDYSKLISYLFG